MKLDAIVGPGLRLLLVGLSPPPLAVATGVPYAHPTNRFYDALFLSGLTSYRIDPRGPDPVASRDHLVARGLGLTRVLDESAPENPSAADIGAGLDRLESFVDAWGPRVVAFVGIGTARTAMRDRKIAAGPLASRIADVPVWALPDTSGLNFRYSAEELADAYAGAGEAAGLDIVVRRRGDAT